MIARGVQVCGEADCGCGCGGAISIKDGKLADLPATVVHITLTLGATKVTHRVVEGNADKLIAAITDILKSRLMKRKPTVKCKK